MGQHRHLRFCVNGEKYHSSGADSRENYLRLMQESTFPHVSYASNPRNAYNNIYSGIIPYDITTMPEDTDLNVVIWDIRRHCNHAIRSIEACHLYVLRKEDSKISVKARHFEFDPFLVLECYNPRYERLTEIVPRVDSHIIDVIEAVMM